jgi:hypothetical protein
VPVVVRETTARGTSLTLPCKGRRCEECGPRYWKPRVKAVLASGLRGRADGALFVTLTAPGIAGGLVDAASIEAWNDIGSKCWNHFFTILRRAFPAATIEYFRVGELQKRGAIHYHVLATGAGFIPHDVLQRLAVRAGFGPVCDVGRLRSAAGGVSYASKYVLKDVEGWPAGRRVWSCSAGWRDPRYWRRYLTPLPPGTWLACRVGGEPMYVSASPWLHTSTTRGGPETRQSREFNEWVRKRHSEALTEVESVH